MEALSIIQQASQSKENFVTQIDLQNLKKELSTDFKNKLDQSVLQNVLYFGELVE
jgi:hypothetical protein